jgi:hypothetical protein
MCYSISNPCRRTKTVCDRPESLELWHQEQARLMQEAAKTHHSILREHYGLSRLEEEERLKERLN